MTRKEGVILVDDNVYSIGDKSSIASFNAKNSQRGGKSYISFLVAASPGRGGWGGRASPARGDIAIHWQNACTLGRSMATTNPAPEDTVYKMPVCVKDGSNKQIQQHSPLKTPPRFPISCLPTAQSIPGNYLERRVMMVCLFQRMELLLCRLQRMIPMRG